jgi:hypothetical protein
LQKLEASGTRKWVRQFGTSLDDIVHTVALDPNGNVYIAGHTSGALDGANAGEGDAFVGKYDPSGLHQWTRQFGTSAFDRSIALAVDSGGSVYVAGYTEGSIGGLNQGRTDAFVRKIDADGTEEWTVQFGSDGGDRAFSIAADSKSAYVTGVTSGSLGSMNAGASDCFLRKIDATGSEQWTAQFGTSGTEEARGVVVDASGGVYVTGYTVGPLGGANAGAADAWLGKYDGGGKEQWTVQFGTPGTDVGNGVAASASGGVYVTGYTTGSFDGVSAGEEDGFLRKFDASGMLQWTRQFGGSRADVPLGVATGQSGTVFVAGRTTSSLGESSLGGLDAFVVEIPDR